MSDFNHSIPKLSIAILVGGTRGDVQPFLAVARKLQASPIVESSQVNGVISFFFLANTF